MVAGEFREGKMRADDSAPPRERSRCFTHLGPDESVANASSGSPPSQVLPTSLLPAGGGGARAATLAFCAHLCPQTEMGQDPCIVRAQTWTFIR